MSSADLHPGVLHHVVNTLEWPELRPLQQAAIEPVRSGRDCLLLAPTAGGKTEAAVFPILSEMADEQWPGLSVLYITPLRALLNNLHPRLSGYSSWVGRRTGIWHGDTGTGDRRQILADPPDILLTTPESLEAMLVSTQVDHRGLFAHLRLVVIDELHAFAGDDRGWHLLALIERLQRLAGRRLQRIGLTATVGNPSELLEWLQGSQPHASGVVVAPRADAPAEPDITIDYVGSIPNAATVVASLHHGEKRLVFSDSRAQAEEMATALRDRGVTTFVSHSSLSADERRRSEQAFAEARDCVVVATSTLELGIDVGDLDRVIQLESPRTVSSFLQRLGRTGRRSGSVRNCLFLATRQDSLLRATALMTLWDQGFVEPVIPPPLPLHIAAQQFMALALQEGRFGINTWSEWWGDIPVMAHAGPVLAHLLDEHFLDVDSGMAFIGPAAEKHFGRRHFMELLSAFTAAPELKVLHGRTEIGAVSPLTVSTRPPAGEPRLLLLAGRTWRVTEIDWRKRRIQVIEERGRGRSRWSGSAPDISFELAQATRQVILGTNPAVEFSRRAVSQLGNIRSVRSGQVDPDAVVIERESDEQTWWTFAGTRANSTLSAALIQDGIEASFDHEKVSTPIVSPEQLRALSTLVESRTAHRNVDQAALDGLKFSAALPVDFARLEVATRMTDLPRALEVLRSPILIEGRGLEQP